MSEINYCIEKKIESYQRVCLGEDSERLIVRTGAVQRVSAWRVVEGIVRHQGPSVEIGRENERVTTDPRHNGRSLRLPNLGRKERVYLTGLLFVLLFLLPVY